MRLRGEDAKGMENRLARLTEEGLGLAAATDDAGRKSLVLANMLQVVGETLLRALGFQSAKASTSATHIMLGRKAGPPPECCSIRSRSTVTGSKRCTFRRRSSACSTSTSFCH